MLGYYVVNAEMTLEDTGIGPSFRTGRASDFILIKIGVDMLTYGLVCQLRPTAGARSLESLQELMDDWQALKSQEKQDEKLYEWRKSTIGSAERTVWQFTLAETTEDDTLWTTEVRATCDPVEPNALTASITMGIETNDSRLAPVRYYITSPRFVRWLADRFVVSFGSTIAQNTPRSVESPEAVAELLDELENPDRALPLLVIGRPGTEVLGAELPEQLARFLFALANVVVLEPPAIGAFANAVGSRMACFDGEARIYWPTWAKTDTPSYHPRYDADTLESWARLNPGAPHEVVRTKLLSPLISASVSRFIEPAGIRETIEAAAREQIVASYLAAEPADRVNTIWDLTAERDDAQARWADAMRKSQGLQNHRDRLEAELEAARRELEWFKKRLPNAEFSKQKKLTVSEAIQRAKAELSETLLFAKNAHVDTDLPGDKVYAVLFALHEVCLQERAGNARDKSALITERMATITGSPGTYKFDDTGVWKYHPETDVKYHLRDRIHFKKGYGDKESFYWETVGPSQKTYRYLIGHIGEHA